MLCGSRSAMGMTPSRGRALEVPVASSLGRLRRRWQCGRCDTPLAEVAQRLRFSHRLPWPRTTAASVKNLRLKVSPNGRYFVDQNGKPFFYLADTCWLLFQRLDHDEVDEYLKDRVAKGFTVIQAYVIRGLGKRHPDGNSSLLGETPFIDRDATRPNEAFFKNVDYDVNRANELGLVMGLVTA